jgi:hypothetical protein
MKRSPNYPALKLSDAIERVRVLFAKDHMTEVSPEVAVGHLGYSGMHGPARTVLSALKKYGLIAEGKTGIRVSDLAVKILHPDDEAERLEAIRDAATRPELLRQLAETHMRASDEAIANHLIKRGFSAAGAEAAVTAFRDAVAVAKLDASGYNPSDDREESEAMTTGGTPTKAIPEVMATLGVPVALRWPLPGGVIAELRFSAPVTKEHFDVLERYLAIAKETAPNIPD